MASKIKVNAIEVSSGADIKIGSGATVSNAGAITATSFSGDGSNLTSIPTSAIVGAVAQGDVDKLNANIAILGFKVAVNGSLAKYNLVDQVIDEFVDNSGIDASASTNEYLSSGVVWGTAGNNYPTGGTVTTYSGYRVHSFTTAGNTNFVVQSAGTVDALIVGGGGGGGTYGGGVIFRSDGSSLAFNSEL